VLRGAARSTSSSAVAGNPREERPPCSDLAGFSSARLVPRSCLRLVASIRVCADCGTGRPLCHGLADVGEEDAPRSPVPRTRRGSEHPRPLHRAERQERDLVRRQADARARQLPRRKDPPTRRGSRRAARSRRSPSSARSCQAAARSTSSSAVEGPREEVRHTRKLAGSQRLARRRRDEGRKRKIGYAASPTVRETRVFMGAA
jgi:hypothetical protein